MLVLTFSPTVHICAYVLSHRPYLCLCSLPQAISVLTFSPKGHSCAYVLSLRPQLLLMFSPLGHDWCLHSVPYATIGAYILAHRPQLVLMFSPRGHNWHLLVLMFSDCRATSSCLTLGCAQGWKSPIGQSSTKTWRRPKPETSLETLVG